MTNQMQTPKFSSKVDPQYVREIHGRQFVLYAGLLDLAKQQGLTKLEVDVLQFPCEANCNTAVCLAGVQLGENMVASDIGEASAENLDPAVAKFLFSMASTRAKARALRNALGIGMTALEELGSFDDIIPADEEEVRTGYYTGYATARASEYTTESPTAPSSEPAAKQPAQQETSPGTKSRTKYGPPRPATGPQRRAIDSIAKRKKFTDERLQDLCQQKFGSDLDKLNVKEASSLIDFLKIAA